MYVRVRYLLRSYPLLIPLLASLLFNLYLTYLDLTRMNSLAIHAGSNRPSDPVGTEGQIELATNDAPSWGSNKAPVTVVIFTDFQCPYCKKFASVLEQAKEMGGNKFRVVVRELPIPKHQFAMREAEIALCSAQQSTAAFWDVYAYFYSRDSLRVDPSGDAIRLMQNRNDIVATRLDTCLRNHETDPQIERDIKLAQKYEINATPTLIVNGSRYVGGIKDSYQLMDVINEANHTNTPRK